MMDLGPRCYIQMFIEISPLVPEKKILRLLAHMDLNLGYVTNIILTNFYFLVPKNLHTKFGQKRSRKKVQWFLRKSS